MNTYHHPVMLDLIQRPDDPVHTTTAQLRSTLLLDSGLRRNNREKQR